MTTHLQHKQGQSENADSLLVRLIMLRRDQVFLSRLSDEYVLPEVQVPKYERMAPHVTGQVFRFYGLEALCLFNPQLRTRTTREPDALYQVLEVTDGHSGSEGTVWVPRLHLPQLRFRWSQDHEMLQSALHEADLYDSGGIIAPFAKAGWLQETVAWMKPFLDFGVELTGKWTQYNSSSTFSLMRFETTGRAIWFKAVGEPNLREYRLTTELAAAHPVYLPRILATRDEVNGWLMEEVDGKHPDADAGLDVWVRIAETLASLQYETSGSADTFVAIGCQDLRTTQLVSRLPDFITLAGQLMGEQVVRSPAPLSFSQLNDLGQTLGVACDALSKFHVPDTLVHADFNPGNIIVGTDRTAFLDWAETYVGQPFFTFEYLLAYLQNRVLQFPIWRQALTKAYLHIWRSFFPAEDLRDSLKVTPLVAVYAYALSIMTPGTLSSSEQLDNSKYVRSLVRRMYRESDTLKAASL
jgi:phosphotransferase family enzyme